MFSAFSQRFSLFLIASIFDIFALYFIEEFILGLLWLPLEREGEEEDTEDDDDANEEEELVVTFVDLLEE